MSITFDTFGTGFGNAYVTESSITWTHTVGSGSDRLLVIGVGVDQGTNYVSDLTVDGTSIVGNLAKFQVFGTISVGIYYLLNPSVGTHTIVATLVSNGRNACGLSTSYFGVEQTTGPIPHSVSGGGSTTANLSIATIISGSGIFVMEFSYAQGSNNPILAGTNCTLRQIATTTNPSGVHRFAIGDSGTGQSVSPFTMVMSQAVAAGVWPGATVAFTASAGVTSINASLSQQLANLTCAATAKVDVSASLSQQLAPATLAASAKVDVSAALSAQLATLTCVAAAKVDVSASLSAQLAPVTLSAAASVPVNAALSSPLAPLTLSATVATVPVALASLTATLAPLTLVATAAVIDPGVHASLTVTLGPLTLLAFATSGTADTGTTLGDLQTLMAQRWDGVVFWTAEEARLALNEALSEWNLLTGHWRTRVSLTPFGGIPEITLPGLMVYGMRIATAAGLPLTPTSLTELDLGRPSWRLETTASGGSVPTRPLVWAPLGLTHIAIWPAYAATTPDALLCDGVMTTPVLVGPDDPVGLGEEIIDYLVDMALHVVSFKEAGARWRATRAYYEAFLQAAAEENGLLKTNQRFRRFAGLDRRRDLQPTTGATNQMQGVATQFSRHDQPEGGGG